MSFVTGLLVYIITWWLILFTILPFGVRREDNPKEGHDPGAPTKPMLWRKIGVTTIVATIIWAGIYYAVSSEIFSFRSDVLDLYQPQ